MTGDVAVSGGAVAVKVGVSSVSTSAIVPDKSVGCFEDGFGEAVTESH